MLVCACVETETEPSQQLARHFGAQPRYLIVDTQTLQTQIWTAASALCKGPCHCYQPPELRDIHFDAVLCHGIGHLVLQQMRRAQIPVYLTQERDLHLAIQELQSGLLNEAPRGRCLTMRRRAPRAQDEQPTSHLTH